MSSWKENDSARRDRAGRPSLAGLFGALALLLVVSSGCTIDIEADTTPIDTETRRFEQSFPIGSETVKLANLAGQVELASGGGSDIVVETTVHAAGSSPQETQELLDSLEWVRDDKGGWALSYPVDDHTKFHYRSRSSFNWGSRTTTKYLGRRVTVTSKRGTSAVTLFADLRIVVPDGSDLAVRNVVGGVEGGDLTADLVVDTGSGDVTLGSIDGELGVDTGSGDVRVSRLHGSGNIDTGSGDVELGGAEGDQVIVDTGSGDVTVRSGRLRSLSVDTGSGDIEARDVDAETMSFDTGSGDVTLSGPLDWARTVVADTGSGDVEIYADPQASFRITADQGSGDFDVRYEDVRWIRSGRKIVGAERGDQHTRIEVDTGSGDCVLAPR